MNNNDPTLSHRLAKALSLAARLANLTLVYLDNGLLDLKAPDHAADSFRDLVARVIEASAGALETVPSGLGPESAPTSVTVTGGGRPGGDAPDLFIGWEDIPTGARLLIFGDPQSAPRITRVLAAQRPDVTVIGIVDFEGGGHLDGLPVISVADLSRGVLSFDLVIVGSILYRRIVRTLRTLGVERLLVTKPELVHDYLYLPEEMQELSPRFSEVLELLETPADKELYAFLLEARTPDNPHIFTETENEVENCYAYLKDFKTVQRRYLKNLVGQYLDFINPQAVRIAVHAGVCDGVSALALLEAFPGMQELYSFDPLGGEYIARETKEALSRSGKFKLFDLALYNHCEGVPFCERPEYPVGSFVPDATQTKGWTRKLPSVTVDAFCAREKIAKLDYLALDVEESERYVLQGGREVIRRDRPILAISIYHGRRDFYEIPLYLKGVLQDYVYRLGHYSYGIYDTILYAIPKETLL